MMERFYGKWLWLLKSSFIDVWQHQSHSSGQKNATYPLALLKCLNRDTSFWNTQCTYLFIYGFIICQFECNLWTAVNKVKIDWSAYSTFTLHIYPFFPDSQFTKLGFSIIRKYWNKNGGGILFYINEDIPFKVIESNALPENLKILT